MLHPIQERRAFLGLGGGYIAACILISCAIVCISPLQSQAATFTNLAQLTRALNGASRATANLQLDATVFACNTNTGALILQDSSGAELLEMNDLKDDLKPGDVVHIEAKPALLSAGELGIYVVTPPLVDNDGIHGPTSVRRDHYFEAGRYPLRLDWFNQRLGSDLGVSCVASGSASNASAAKSLQTNFLQAIRAKCFQGSWSKLPNFQMLEPLKAGAVTNFGLDFRTRDEMVGIRFEGYFDAPESGRYRFELTSDDGSRLWIGPAGVSVKKTGVSIAPTPGRVNLAEPMDRLDARHLVTVEGRPSFVVRSGKGLTLELRSGQNSVSVVMADAGNLDNADLLNAHIRVSGIAANILIDDQTIRLGTVAVANPDELVIVEHSVARGKQPSTLTTVMQVHSLTRDAATLKVPVRIRGTVTAVAPVVDRWMVIQDDTRGVFVDLSGVPNCHPNSGEFWSINGYTQPGDFSPSIAAEQATLLGKSRMPEPARPTWSQLANGSMDVQWVELQGLVTGIHSNVLSFVTAEGHLEVAMASWGESELKPFDHAIVSIRGALFADWNAETHEVYVAKIAIFNGSVMVDTPAPRDPFDTQEKTVRSLLRFDPEATPFQRVKVRGVVTYAAPRHIFLEQGAGIEVLPSTTVNFKVGDSIEAVGYPEIYGVTTRLREAILRKTGEGPLPPAPRVSDSDLASEKFAAVRISVEGKLAGFHAEANALILQIQTHAHLVLARVADGASLRSLRPGSKLLVNGVFVPYADLANLRNGSHFELLVNGPGDVMLLSQPSWWTLQRLLSAVGVLLLTLALAGVWISMLRRQVTQRTLLLKHEIRARERVEHEHALEAERSRIARDLHDDLGSRLTEINFLASTSQLSHSPDETHTTFKAISERARALVNALDVIVWAVNPEDNSLQSLADYLCSYTREYLTHSSILCRFKVPIACPNLIVEGQVRHEIFMVVKEALNNIVRHAEATEVKFQMTIGDDLEIAIIDNGKGFDSARMSDGHGVKNCAVRLEKIGGCCQVESLPGTGTTVRIKIPVPCLTVSRIDDENTVMGYSSIENVNK